MNQTLIHPLRFMNGVRLAQFEKGPIPVENHFLFPLHQLDVLLFRKKLNLEKCEQ